MIEIQDEHDTELLALFNYLCNKKSIAYFLGSPKHTMLAE